MTRNKSIRFCLERISDDISRIEKYAKGVDFSNPEGNEQALDAIGFRMAQIKESIDLLPAEFINSHEELNLGVIS